MKLVHELFKASAKRYGSLNACVDEYSGYSVTYKQLDKDIINVAGALQSLGLKQGMHVSQFSENSSKWIVLDVAIFNCGAVNAVRGSLAPIAELEYIYNHSDSVALVTDNIKVIEGLKDALSSNATKFIVYIGKDEIPKNLGLQIYTFEDLMEIGKKQTFTPVDINGEDVATLIYSSGTTGKPKGIMLTHNNLASQVVAIEPSLVLKETKTIIAVLPIWHAYERTCEYFLFSVGTQVCYTNVKNFKKDLQNYNPHYLIGVPRLYEAIYDGIQAELKKKSKFANSLAQFFFSVSGFRNKYKKIINGTNIFNQTPSMFQKIYSKLICMALFPLHSLGKALVYKKLYNVFGNRFVKGIAGGGAMAAHIDDFYLSIELDVFVGYGLTEASPVLAVRLGTSNKAYSCGPALYMSEFLIVDPETKKPLPKGQHGLVLAKGPNIMKGYYKDPENTKKVLLPNGYLDTGDLGWLTNDDYLVLTGRIKDIIVLSNGENIEPEPLELTCMSSPFVKQIVVAGQDKNALSALVVPDMDALKDLAAKRKISATDPLKSPEIKNEILKELRTRIQERSTFRDFERLSNIEFLDEGFTPENGLMTMTAKVKKNEVYEKYKEKIEAMYR